MKKKQKVQIFKLEERVLFDGAAAAEIVAAVNNAANADNADADQNSDDSEQGKEEKLVQNTVKNAGPVDTPAADANVQNEGEGLPQADAAQNDPAEVLINGNADFTAVTDPNAAFSGDVAEFIQAAAEPEADAASDELIVIDADAADQFDADQFEGKNILVLDGDSDAADQIDDWMNEHSDQDINEVRLITDSDTLASQISDLDVDVVTVNDFQAELADADSADMVIIPDHEANITVEPQTDPIPEELSSDAEADRHELVIVNSSMSDLDAVLDQLGDSRDVLVIDSTGDAFEQISEYLGNSDTAYDAVHILTHGNDEGFYLGHQKVVAADQMAVFDGHMAEHGDFMLYGCDLASTEHGQALVNSIADYTGCDVAASVNNTGAADLGGDWNLEYSSGAIETSAISLDAAWDHSLATITVDSTATVDPEKNIYDTFYKAWNKALNNGDAENIIEILNVDNNDHGPSGNIEIHDKNGTPHSLTITISTKAEETVSFDWQIDALSITNATLQINHPRISLTGGTVNVNNNGSLILTNGSTDVANSNNPLNNNITVNLANGGKLEIGSYSRVSRVDAHNGATITFDAGSSTVDTLYLRNDLISGNGASWSLPRGTIGTLYNYGTTTASGANFQYVNNHGSFTLSGGSVKADSDGNGGYLNHSDGTFTDPSGVSQSTFLKIAGGSVDKLAASGNTTMTAGSVTYADFSGGTIAISGGSITVLKTVLDASETITISGGTIGQDQGKITGSFTHHSGILKAIGGRITTLYNHSTAAGNKIDGATIALLVNGDSSNSGTMTMDSGVLDNLDNERGTMTFNGGSVNGVVTNALTGTVNVDGSVTTGQVINEGNFNLSGVLSIPTGNGETAFVNRTTGTVTFNNGTLSNPNPINGIGLSNPDGGMVNATEATATIQGFTFATEIPYSDPLQPIPFNPGTGNTYSELVSLVVRGNNTAIPDGVVTMNDALQAIDTSTAGSVYSITINLLVSEYSSWNDYLTVTGSYSSDFANLFKISSTTMANKAYVSQNVILATSLTFAPVDNGGTITLENVSMTVNSSGKLTIPAGSAMLLTGTNPRIVSVTDATSDYPAIVLTAAASNIVNSGVLTVKGTVRGIHDSLSGKLQSIVNHGEMNLDGGNFLLERITVKSNEVNPPEVDGIYNTGKLTINNALLTADIPSGVFNSALVRSEGKADISGSVFQLFSLSSGNAYALYNNGKTMTVKDSFIYSTGHGLYNDTDGVASFIVTQKPSEYLDNAEAQAVVDSWSSVLNRSGDYGQLIYNITGGAYSIYSLGTLTVVSEPGLMDTYEAGASYVRYTNAPVLALNGNVYIQAKATAGTGEITTAVFEGATFNGNLTVIGNARVELNDTAMNGSVNNGRSGSRGGALYITGKFINSDFMVTGSSAHTGTFTDVTVITNYKSSGSYGNVYFGTSYQEDGHGHYADTVVFNSAHPYRFVNYAGEMSIYNFSGLSSKDVPVQIYNSGRFYITNPGYDPATPSTWDNLYDLYVYSGTYGNGTYAVLQGQEPFLMPAHGPGYSARNPDSPQGWVSDLGIINRDDNTVKPTYYFVNEMILSGLNIRNTQNDSVAVTNYAGTVTVNGGSIQASYSGFDSLVNYQFEIFDGGDFRMFLEMPVVSLNNVNRIAGSAYSVRNSGIMTVDGIEVKDGTTLVGTLFTNQLDSDFSPTFTGSYTAFANDSTSLLFRERIYTSSEIKINDINIFLNTGIQDGMFFTTVTKQTPPRLASNLQVYRYLSTDPYGVTLLQDHPEVTDSKSYPDSQPVYTDYHWGNFFIASEATLTGVAFRAVDANSATAIQNWGTLTVTKVNSDPYYQFSGFVTSIDNGYTYHLASNTEDAWDVGRWTSSLAILTNGLTPTGDYELGFDVAASSILTFDEIPSMQGWQFYVNFHSEMTLRGVADSNGLYSGCIVADGAQYVVHKFQTLNLINFSVSATGSNALYVSDEAYLNIFNGKQTDAGSEWKGPSNSCISAEGNTAIVNDGQVFAVNAAIINSKIGLNQHSGGRSAFLNTTFYNNETGILSDSSGSTYVVDSTIVSGPVIVDQYGNSNSPKGIVLNSAKGNLILANSIVLAASGTAINNPSGAEITEYGENIYANSSSETTTKLNEVYGTTSFGSLTFDSNNMGLVLSKTSTALTASGIAVSYTFDPDTSLYSFSFGGTADISVTLDKGGNRRLQSGGNIAIGSYLNTDSVSVTYVVTTLTDTDQVITSSTGEKLYSLRYIINRLLGAENVSADYMVMFDWGKLHDEAQGNDHLTISLDSALGSLMVAHGADTPITVLAIDLNAAQYEIPSGYTLNIDGSALTSSVFTVSGIALTVNGVGALTVTGSANTADNGAAFNLANVAGTSLALADLKVTGGNTTGTGGAVYVGGSNASLTTTGTTFSNNFATNGGAVYNNGGTVSINGTLKNNTAAENGGAIYNNGGTLTVSGTLSNNNADGDGGAIYSTNGMTVSGTLSGNIASNGGAIYNAAGTASISADLTDNTATGSGGALYNAGTANVTGSVTGNAAVDGGGIYNTGTLTVGNLSGNTAAAAGGALYNTGTATVNGNIAENTAVTGGGIYNTGKLTVNGNITGNEATNGAGIYSTAGSVTMTGNLTGNTASAEGAGAYIDGGSFTMLGDITGNTGNSIIYVGSGQVRLGDLTHYMAVNSNTGSVVKQAGGDVLMVNAAVRENDPGSGNLFEITGGVFTLLNSTVTANSGNILNQSGGKVQIGDSTIAFNADNSEITVSGGTLDVVNSIINVSNDFTATHEVGSLINQNVSEIFLLKSGEPVDGPNGTLQIKLSGKAGRGGVMVGYKQDGGATTLYYTTDGTTWQTADGSAVSVPGIIVVEKSENNSERLYNGYAFLSIGAFSLKATEMSLVVTISGDEPQDGETTLRDALEYAEYLYILNGTIETVTFKVDEVYLNSTITIGNPVIVSGGGVTITATDLGPGPEQQFSGDSVFVIDGNAAAVFKNATVVGKKGVRGFRVDSGDLTLKHVTIRNGQADGTVEGSEARGGAVYVKTGGSLSGSNVTFEYNLSEDGSAVYSENSLELNGFTIKGNVATGSDGNTIYVKGDLLLKDGVVNDNQANGNIIRTTGTAALVSVSADGNVMGSSLLNANSADIVNSTLTGDPNNGAALVYVTTDANIANSIIVTGRGNGSAILAGDVSSVYSIYSGTLENLSFDVQNVTGMSSGDLFTGRDGDGRLVIAEGSPAAAGVWTTYDADTREIAYSERPEGIWTVKYTPENMTWRYLGGAAAKFQRSLLVGSSDMPSIGAYWLTGGNNHPDYGPGVNDDMIDPTYNGGFGRDWNYSSVVNGYLANPASQLFDPSESGMGWYSSLLSDLFGFKSQQTRVLSADGGIPAEEIDLSVDGTSDTFEEFQESPYHAQDGTPLSESELNAIRSAAVTGRIPAESVRPDAEVSEQVASSLRSAEAFKDGFDKALDYLLGLDA